MATKGRGSQTRAKGRSKVQAPALPKHPLVQAWETRDPSVLFSIPVAHFRKAESSKNDIPMKEIGTVRGSSTKVYMCLGKSGFKAREEDPLAVNIFFYTREEVGSTKSGVKYRQANVENINLFYGQQDLNGHPNWFPREHGWSGAGPNNTQCNREWRLYLIDLYERGLEPELVLALKRQANAQKGKTTTIRRSWRTIDVWRAYDLDEEDFDFSSPVVLERVQEAHGIVLALVTVPREVLEEARDQKRDNAEAKCTLTDAYQLWKLKLTHKGPCFTKKGITMEEYEAMYPAATTASREAEPTGSQAGKDIGVSPGLANMSGLAIPRKRTIPWTIALPDIDKLWTPAFPRKVLRLSRSAMLERRAQGLSLYED